MQAYEAGPDKNIEWLHTQVPEVWRQHAESLSRHRRRPAAREDGSTRISASTATAPSATGRDRPRVTSIPPPLNFTTLRRHLVENRYIGGIFYYQIMNGITGTAMPYFKKHLESEKIWDLANYLAVVLPRLHRCEHRAARHRRCLRTGVEEPLRSAPDRGPEHRETDGENQNRIVKSEL